MKTTTVLLLGLLCCSAAAGSGPAMPEGMPLSATQTRDTILVAAGAQYAAGPLQRLLLGSEYRDLWTVPLRIPVLDLDRTSGGLSLMRVGGGKQTTTLHLAGKEGANYIVRSVQKNNRPAVPPAFQATLLADIAQDQVSSLNPFGALIIPHLAEAAGILHTTPRLVALPLDPRLGEDYEAYAGMPALLETRVDEKQIGAERFGSPEVILDSEDLLDRLRDDPAHRVDPHAFARARLFDMLIGDTDRHEGQWLWAGSGEERDTVYRPIPLDRDFAFADYDGLLLKLGGLGKQESLRRLSRFDGTVDVPALTYNASPLDLRLLYPLERQDWVGIAEDLQARLTDSVIEQAVRAWPQPVFERAGPATIAALTLRRDRLADAAVAYYERLAEIVDVPGTNEPERFRIERTGDAALRLEVYALGPESEPGQILLRRTFSPSETTEIRLYGRGGDDAFEIAGTVEGLTLRVIGGSGNDTFLERPHGTARAGAVAFYDTRTGNVWGLGPGAEEYHPDDPDPYRYRLRPIQPGGISPLATLAYSTETGLALIGGVQITERGFGKSPYAASHRLAAYYRTRTDAFGLTYRGVFPSLVGRWDAEPEGALRAPGHEILFFGLGNETARSEDPLDTYEVSYAQFYAAPSLRRELAPEVRIDFGPFLDYTRVEASERRPIQTPQVTLPPGGRYGATVLGFRAGFEVEADTARATLSGLRWLGGASLHADLGNTGIRYLRLASEVSYRYTPPVGLPLTLALRAGGATNVGDFLFFQANTLGGRSNLRGYPKMRFAGRSSLYTNAELRLKLFDFNAYVVKGSFGTFGFLDQGRVWSDEEDSDLWHQGYGGGVWVRPFYQVVLSGTLAFSDEDRLFDLGIGFFF